MVEVEGSTDEEGEPDSTGIRPNKLAKKVLPAVAETIRRTRQTKKTGLNGNVT